MIQTIALIYLTLTGFRAGRGAPDWKKKAGRATLVYLIAAGIGALLSAARSVDQVGIVVGYAILAAVCFGVFMGIGAVVKLLVERRERRKEVSAILCYLNLNGHSSAPLPWAEVKAMWDRGSIHEGTPTVIMGREQWSTLKDVAAFMEARLHPKAVKQIETAPSVPKWIVSLKALMLDGWQNLRYDDLVKRRYLIPTLIVSTLLGASIMGLISTRYYVFTVGGGVVVKTDRWTGKTWVQAGPLYNPSWTPVRESP